MDPEHRRHDACPDVPVLLLHALHQMLATKLTEGLASANRTRKPADILVQDNELTQFPIKQYDSPGAQG